MNDAGRNKLRSWLQTSLANHPEGGNGLVDYVEAIVGDGEGEDDDLREKWTEKLDDFLAESSADFAEVLLNGIRSGNFSKSWREGGGGGGDVEDPYASTTQADEASKGAPDASEGRLETMDVREEDDPYDVVGDDDDEEDDEDGGRSRRNRRRQWEEEPPEATESQVTDNGRSAEGDSGGRKKGQGQDQEARSNKRARIEGTAGGRGGRGNGVNSRNVGPNPTKGSRGGQQGRGFQAPGSKGVGPSVAGRGHQAPGNKNIGPSVVGRGRQFIGGPAGFGQGPLPMGDVGPGGLPGYWVPDMMNPGRGPGGMHQGSFGAPRPIGPNGMRPLIGGPGMPMGGPGLPGGSLGMPLMGRGMPQGRPGMTAGRPVMPGVGPGMEARESGMHGRGSGVEAIEPGMHGRGPGMNGRGPGMEARGPGIHGRGPGMNGRGPGMEARGLVIHGRGSVVEARGPGIPASGPGGPRDTPGMSRDAPGIPKERGSGMPAGRGNSGKPVPLEAGINGSRRVEGNGLLPTPQAGPPRGVRGPPLLPGPPPPLNDGVGVSGGRRGAGPVDPRESMGPGDGRIAVGGDGVMTRRSPERRSPNRDPASGSQTSGSGVLSGGPRGPVAGEGQGVGMSRPGPPEHRQGDMRNGEQGGMRGPEGLFEARDPARQGGGGRVIDRPSELNTNMSRMSDSRGSMDVSRGPGMRQGGRDGLAPVPEESSGGENDQGVRRSVFDRLGARPSEDDVIGQQGREHQQQQRPAMPESFRADPNTRNLPETTHRDTPNNPTGGQGGHRVMSTGGRGPPHMNAQAGRGGGQGMWPGPPALRSNQQHDGGRVGSGVVPEFHRGGAGGGMGMEMRRYPGEGLGRGVSEGEPRRVNSPMLPDARGAVPGHPVRNQHGPHGDGRGGVQQQVSLKNAQSQARRPPVERREVEHVSSGGGHFDGGSFRQVGGVGPGRGHGHRQGAEDLGHVGGRLQQGIEDGYPRERQHFQGSVSGRGGEAGRGGGVHTGDGNSRPWRQSEVIDGSGAGGGRSGVLMEVDHSRNHHPRQRGAILQQDSSVVARDAGRGQRGGIAEDGGSALWGKNPGQDQNHQVEWNRRNPHESHGIQSNRGPTHAPGPRSSGPPDHFALQHDGDQVHTRRHDRDRPHGWSERGRNQKIQERGAGRALGTQRARSPSLSGPRVTVRVTNVPADISQAALLQHFESFGEVVAISLRLVKPEEGGKGQKEALVQFGSPRQAQVCLSSPKAVADNRFIVVQPSDVNLIEVDPSVKQRSSSIEKEAVVSKIESAAVSKAEEAAAAIVARKLAQEKLLAQASKTKEVVAQQKLLILLRERVKIATQDLEATKTRRTKVQKFLKMMEDKHKPESEQMQYREKLTDLSNKISALEAAAEIGEVHAQARKLEELEAEARSIGATVPPPPNADVLAKLIHMDGSNGSRGKGHGATLTAAAEPRGSRSLDNRPTTVKVSGLPEGAGEGDLRVHANMAGVLLGAAMLDRPGEGVVKFAERWAAENFMAKSRSFGGIPLSMSWYTGPFPPVQQRKGLKPSPPQQPRTVVLNPDTEDRIELKLAPVQEGYGGAGGQAGSGSRSWGDNLGKKEVVTWGEAEGTRHGVGSNDSSSGSPLQLPKLQGGQDDDEVYQNMGL